MAAATPSPLDGLPCPWLRIDAIGRIEAGNAALAALLGCDRETIMGSFFDAWLSPASRVMYQSLVQPLLKLHGQVSELALRVRTPPGTSMDVLFYAANEAAGSVSVQLVAIRQRRRIENELLRVKRAADQAPGMIFQLERVDAEGWRFPYVSDAVRSLYGVTAEEAARSADAIFRHWWPQDRLALLNALERAAKDGSAFLVLVRVGASEPAGAVAVGPRWHEIQGQARRQGDGSTLWHGYLADVSERVATQDAIVQRRAFEGLARTRSEFIARVSHELRTPLNGIMGFAQLLASDPTAPLSASQLDRLKVILDSGHHLLGVVNQLLDISRIEAGQLNLTLQPVMLQPLAAQVLQVMAAGAQHQGIALRLESSSHQGAALAEPQRLRQALLNLVSNAVKYNRPGGQVTVSTWANAAEAGIEIADTGAGLSEAQIAELFQPFNRLGAERTAVEGAGLGLVVSQHMIELMGGRITVHSEIGAGSTFGVVLPAAAAATPGFEAVPDKMGEEQVKAAELAAAKVRGQVLYVEDNPVNALLMEGLLLRRPQVTLHLAADARRALELAQCSPLSLLLIDMHLPDATGAELLRQLRQLPDLRKVPAIVVSASAGGDAEEQARLDGFDGYWTKPLDLAKTLTELDRWLSPKLAEHDSAGGVARIR